VDLPLAGVREGVANQNPSRPQQNPSRAQQKPSPAQQNQNFAQQNQNKILMFFNILIRIAAIRGFSVPIIHPRKPQGGRRRGNLNNHSRWF
jgi:uncharacterized MAPEG superfamily protein